MSSIQLKEVSPNFLSSEYVNELVSNIIPPSTHSNPSTKGVKRTQRDSLSKSQTSLENKIQSCKDRILNLALEELKSGKSRALSKIGSNVTAKQWIKEHPDLAFKNKSEIIARLKIEFVLAKADECERKKEAVDRKVRYSEDEYSERNSSEDEYSELNSSDEEYGEENGIEEEYSVENHEETNKNIGFEARSLFDLLTVINNVIERADKKHLVEFVCRIDNLQVLHLICQKEKKDAGGNINLNYQYPWKGNFTGYTNLIDMLKYVIEKRCSPKVVQFIAEKIYGTLHTVYNGQQYIEDTQFQSIQKSVRQQSPVMEDCLKKAIEFNYKGAVLVALGGDIFYCLRLMRNKIFGDRCNPQFAEAYSMIKETVADVMSSWVKNKERKPFVKNCVQYLLDEGISIDISKFGKEKLITEMEEMGIKIMYKKEITTKQLAEILEKKGQKEALKQRLNKDVVGAFISVLYFRYPDVVLEEERGYFTLKTPIRDENRKFMVCKKLNDGEPLESLVLGVIKSLNASNHARNSWLFREILENIVNDEVKFAKLQAVCVAICEEPMQRLLKSVIIPKDMENVLKFVRVDYTLEIDERNVITGGMIQSIQNSATSSSSSEDNTLKFSTKGRQSFDGVTISNSSTRIALPNVSSFKYNGSVSPSLITRTDNCSIEQFSHVQAFESAGISAFQAHESILRNVRILEEKVNDEIESSGKDCGKDIFETMVAMKSLMWTLRRESRLIAYLERAQVVPEGNAQHLLYSVNQLFSIFKDSVGRENLIRAVDSLERIKYYLLIDGQHPPCDVSKRFQDILRETITRSEMLKFCCNTLCCNK